MGCELVVDRDTRPTPHWSLNDDDELTLDSILWNCPRTGESALSEVEKLCFSELEVVRAFTSSATEEDKRMKHVFFYVFLESAPSMWFTAAFCALQYDSLDTPAYGLLCFVFSTGISAVKAIHCLRSQSLLNCRWALTF